MYGKKTIRKLAYWTIYCLKYNFYYVYFTMHSYKCRKARTYLEAIILRARVFSLRVRCCSELQSARVDVEASVFCGERGRHQLVILRPGERWNYC